MSSERHDRRPALLRLLMLIACALGTAAYGQGTPQARFVPETAHVLVGLNSLNGYNEGGQATDASVNDVYGIAFDSKGNVYYSSRGDNLVRRINAADGTVTTVAGILQGLGGSGGSPELKKLKTKPVHPHDAPVAGTSVSLDGPLGIAIDASDNLYIADSNDAVIYKIDTQGNATVVAGSLYNAGFSGDGGLATDAALYRPNGVAVDLAGNLYIADMQNSVIRKVSAADGTISTIAGTPQTYGFSGDGGPAASAQLSRPRALALDRSGNLFIADTYNEVVRRVDAATGTITTVAGQGESYGESGDGGPATSARFGLVYGVAVDAAGQIYVADRDYWSIRKVGTDGIITTIAGLYDTDTYLSIADGGAALSQVINQTGGVAVDAKGSVYIGTVYASQLLRLGPGGVLDFGNQAKSSSAVQTIMVENTGSAPLHLGGFNVSGGTGFTAATSAVNGCAAGTVLAPGLSCGIDVTFSPLATNTYSATLNISDDAPDQIQTADLRGVGVLPATDTTITLSPDTIEAGSSSVATATVTPHSGSGAVPGGTVVFVDGYTGNTLGQSMLDGSGVAMLTLSGLTVNQYAVSAQYGGSAVYAGSNSEAAYLTVTPRASTTSLTVSGSTTLTATVTGSGGTPTGQVQFLDSGAVLATAQLSGGTASTVLGALLPGNHSLTARYVGDTVFAPSTSAATSISTHGGLLQFVPGTTTLFAGVPSDVNHTSFSGDGGPATQARFHTPFGLAADDAGSVYIADEQNNVIRKVTPDGIIQTVAGIPYVGSIYSTRFGGDGGPALNAYLDNPSGVAVAPNGDLYIADFSNNVVRKVTAATGIITTVAGNNIAGYNVDSGVATAVQLSRPISVALDKAGNLYIAEYSNNLVRKVDTSGNLTIVAGYLYQYGTVPATQVRLSAPSGVAIDPSGNLYVADTNNGRILKVDAAGNLTTVAGGGQQYYDAGDGGPATSAGLLYPGQLSFDKAGNLYIVEQQSDRLRKVDLAGIITTIAGYSTNAGVSHSDPGGAPSTRVPLLVPSGVTVDASGSVIISVEANESVFRVGPQGIAVFGPQALGTTSDPQFLTIYNAGDAAITFGSTPFSVTGDYIASAGGTAPCVFSAGLAPGASCTMSTSYKPNGGGYTGSITFASNAAGTPSILLQTNINRIASTTLLQASAQSVNLGDNLLLFAQVAAQGTSNGVQTTGTLAFYDGSTLLGTAPLSGGYAYIYTATLGAGDHSITAVYSGDGFYAPSTSDVSVVTVNNVTKVSLTSSSTDIGGGQEIALTATATPAAVGTMTFSDGGTVLGTATTNASGVAVFTTSALTSTGTHSITASFSGGGGAGTSPAVVVTVRGAISGYGLPDYVINAQVPGGTLPVVVRRGQSVKVLLDVELLSYVSTTVQLTCGTLPSYATCSFDRTSVYLTGNGDQESVVLTINTTPQGAGASLVAKPVMVKQGGPHGLPALLFVP